MTVLHLGVVDQPYAEAGATNPAPRVTKKRGILRVSAKRLAREYQSGPTAAPTQTTGDVAEALELRYGIMEHFFNLHGQEIADAMAESVRGALETVLMGGAPAADPEAEGMERIGEMFRAFLDDEELAGVIGGVPTAAALAGVDHRLKHPTASGNPRRPSFIDTGAFRASFIAWVDGNF